MMTPWVLCAAFSLAFGLLLLCPCPLVAAGSRDLSSFAQVMSQTDWKISADRSQVRCLRHRASKHIDGMWAVLSMC